MPPHVYRYTETNSRNIVPVCACGWIGLVCITPIVWPANTVITRYDYDVSHAAAQKQWGEHVRAARLTLV